MEGPVHVLYVDDDPDRRDRTAASLQRVDDRLSVATAATPSAGLDHLADRPVDCVVCEYGPPELDGLAFLERVRTGNPDLPFVLVTDRGSESVASEAVSLDATDYLRRDDAGAARLAERVADAAETWRAQREEIESLREDSELLDAIFRQLPVHLFVKDEEARYVRVNQYYLEEDQEFYDQYVDEYAGPGSLLGKTDLELYPEEFSRRTYEDDVEVIETGESIVDQEEYVSFVGEWNIVSKVPWRSPDDEIKGLIGVARRITQRKAYEQSLERQNERLERVTSVVAHDLRNPLNVADGYLEAARAERDGEHLAAAVDAIERCEEIVVDMLTFLRRGRDVEDVEPVALDAFSRTCWENVPTGSATLEVADPPTVEADPTRLRHLLENLFSNSVEHAGEDVTVRVGSLEGDDGFYVEDDGPGIRKPERDDVFETGYSTSTEGTGLGLSIVEEMAGAHGWDVTATDGGAVGARFEIRETSSHWPTEYGE